MLVRGSKFKRVDIFTILLKVHGVETPRLSCIRKEGILMSFYCSNMFHRVAVKMDQCSGQCSTSDASIFC